MVNHNQTSPICQLRNAHVHDIKPSEPARKPEEIKVNQTVKDVLTAFKIPLEIKNFYKNAIKLPWSFNDLSESEKEDRASEKLKEIIENINSKIIPRLPRNFNHLSQNKKTDAVINAFMGKYFLENSSGVFHLISDLDNYSVRNRDLINKVADVAVGFKDFNLLSKLDMNDLLLDEDFYRIAMEMAEEDADKTLKLLKKFDWHFQDRKKLLEIIKVLVKRYPYHLLKELVEKYQITKDDELFEIAKGYARKCGGICSRDFEFFHVVDQEKKIELLKIAAASNGYLLMYNLRSFGITDTKELSNIEQIAQRQVGPKLSTKLIGKKDTKNERYFEEHFKSSQKLQPQLFKKIDQYDSQYLQSSQREWLVAAYHSMGVLPEDYSRWKWINEFNILESLLNFRRPDLKWSVTKELALITDLKNSAKIYHKLRKDLPSGNWSPIACILYTKMLINGVDEKVIHEFRQKTEKSFFLGDQQKGHSIIETLLALDKALPPKHIEEVLKKCMGTVSSSSSSSSTQTTKSISNRELLNNLKAVTSVIGFGQAKKLLKKNKSVQQTLQDKFVSAVPVHSINNFTSQYLKTFASCRIPQAIMTYAGKINSLHNKAINNALSEYVTGVLNGTFKSQRYEVNRNKHLFTINEHDSEILEKWKKNLSAPLSSMKSGSSQSFTYMSWLKMKLIDDSHMSMNNLPHLRKFLESKTDNERENTIKGLDEETQNSKYVTLQRLLIQLVTVTSENQQLENLQEIQKMLKNAPFDKPEFLNDVKGRIDDITNPKELKTKKYVVTETDSPYDLLLCGTEVSGSCQRVDGNPQLNVGLLGYLLHGQTKMIAIKTESGDKGKIVGRCMIRLLWNDKKPVLFLERYYGSYDDEMKEAIESLAKEKAKSMGLDLVQKYGTGPEYKKTLESLGGPSPYEYVDGASSMGLAEYGKFTIYDSTYVQ